MAIPPTEKQLQFAKAIAHKLELKFSPKVTKSKLECGKFIKANVDKFYADNDSVDKEKKKKKEKKEKISNTQQSIENIQESSSSTKIIKYWHEGLVRTAFESVGELESALEGIQSFTWEKINYALSNFPCKDLKDKGKDESFVRHLIMYLENKSSSKSNSKNLVIFVFPLAICFNDDEENHAKLAYEWRRESNEIPLFNHRILGEEAEVDGLMLHNSDDLGSILENAGSAGDFCEKATLVDSLQFIDRCLSAVSDQEEGCSGWITKFDQHKKANASLRNKQVRFKLVDGNAAKGASINIRLCYEELLSIPEGINHNSLSLLKQFLGKEKNSTPDSFTKNKEILNWSELHSYLGHMDNRDSQKGRVCYSLDPSQRMAITLFKNIKENQLLAVNGPLGTGKTSLLRAVIADEWIQPLLTETINPDCPIIIACAATNQAVTNVISSFESVPGPKLFDQNGGRNNNKVSLESRWLPHLVSYGWYQPSSFKSGSNAFQDYQVITRKSASEPWMFHCASENFGEAEKNIGYLESCYLAVANEYLGESHDINTYADLFRTKIKSVHHEIINLSQLLTRWKNKLSGLSKSAWSVDVENKYYVLIKKQLDWESPYGEYNQIESNVQQLKSELKELAYCKSELNIMFNSSISYKFKRYINRLFFCEKSKKHWISTKSRLEKLNLNLPEKIEEDNWFLLQKKISEFQRQLQNDLSTLAKDKIRLQKNHMVCKEQLLKLEEIKAGYLVSHKEAHNIECQLVHGIENISSDDIDDLILQIKTGANKAWQFDGNELEGYYCEVLIALQNWIDKNIRPRLFHLSARYWEARYIMYKKSLPNDCDYIAPSIMRIRELAMLAPVFVTTSFSAPKLMRCSDKGREFNYLYGSADLLIVDEAGQSTPEIAGCVFAFAKRAIVVGDTKQLNPVWNLDEAIDEVIYKKHGFTQPLSREKEYGWLMSSGSIMKMAQKTSAFYDAHVDVRGVMLTNHYRCRSPIIDICNEMVYSGALSVVKAATEPEKEWRLPLGFLVVPGESTRLSSGSRCNQSEAQWIARWIKEQKLSILQHYNSGVKQHHLADLVAILTPFKGQVGILKQAIAKEFGENIHDEHAIANKMVIGTVHSLQGSERPIVLFSMVDTTEPTDKHFYDDNPSLINVAVSRAKEVFIVAIDQKAVDYGRKITRKKLKKPSDYLFYHIVNRGCRINSRRLLVIESPNKQTHIESALEQGMELEIIATNGHLTQLESSNNWDPLVAEAPEWLGISEREHLLYQRTAILWPDLEAIYIATDPDAEGECIAWHFMNRVREYIPTQKAHSDRIKIKRMRFYSLNVQEITKAYHQAESGLDAGLVKSALFRTILDQVISRHYPQKLGLGETNSFYAGIGRVQLAILDIVHSGSNYKEQYYIEVTIVINQHGTTVKFILSDNETAKPIIFSDPIKIKAAQKKVSEILKNLPDLQLNWKSKIEQIDEYPAINTASFLALAAREHKISPKRTMELLQSLYEGQIEATQDLVTEVV